MELSQLKDKLEEGINNLNEQINNFFLFVGVKLKDYKNLSLGEQVSYPAVGLGLLLILISLIMFTI